MQKMDEGSKITFSPAFQGAAYEFFVLGLKKEGLEVAKNMRRQSYPMLLDNLNENIPLAVFTIFYANVKNESHFKDNYFFQIMEGKLESLDPKYPQGEMFQFDALRRAWTEVFGETIRTQTISLDSITGELSFDQKIESKKK